jgi:hypothetical protein
MILLDDIIHVLTRSTLAFLRKQPFSLEVADSADVGGILVDIDYPWCSEARSAQDFAEETLGCTSAAGLIQEKIECLAA